MLYMCSFLNLSSGMPPLANSALQNVRADSSDKPMPFTEFVVRQRAMSQKTNDAYTPCGKCTLHTSPRMWHCGENQRLKKSGILRTQSIMPSSCSNMVCTCICFRTHSCWDRYTATCSKRESVMRAALREHRPHESTPVGMWACYAEYTDCHSP